MEDITALNTVGASGISSDLFGSGSEVMGKEDFLKILVTQLQNQDPLDPSNPDEFASQLAQFSSLEQMQNMNSNLEGAIELDLLLNQAINNTMATTLIGRNVKASGNAAELGDASEPVNLHFDLGGTAKNVKVEIHDEEGNLVRTLEVNDLFEGDHKIEWDGKDSDGEALEAGKYSFNVSAEDIEGNSVDAVEYIVGRIDSIRYADGNAILRIGNLHIGLEAVSEIGYGERASDTAQSDDASSDDSGEDDSEDEA